MSTAAPTLARDVRVLGLIGMGHFLSHFYQLCLPPLIIVWHAEFGASYTALGAILTVFMIATGLVQIPAGIAVDRWGARPILVAGLLVEGAAIAAMGFAPSIAALLVLAAIAGVGNSVFHPADYAILNSSIDPSRMGKAFSLHTFSGHLGGAIAPATIVLLISLKDWHAAVMATGAVGIAVALLLLLPGGILKDEHDGTEHDGTQASGRPAPKAAAGWRENVRLMAAPPMLLLFSFFLIATLASGGVSSFSLVANVQVHNVSLETAGTALTAFLFASAAGILLGGVAADKTERHDWQAMLAFLLSAIIFAGLAMVTAPGPVLVVVFLIAGLAQGLVRPARDMMVRALAPKGATGRVFAFASTGIAVGGAAAPLLFGYIIDSGAVGAIFWLLAAFNLIAVATVFSNRRPAPPS